MGIVFRRSHSTKARTDVHEGGNDGTHAGDIVHIIHQHHKASPSQHQKYIHDEIADGQVNDLRIDRALIHAHRYNRHGLEKDAFDRGHPIFTDNDVMDDLDAAGGRTGASPDKTYCIKKHLGCLGPFFIIGRGETGGS